MKEKILKTLRGFLHCKKGAENIDLMELIGEVEKIKKIELIGEKKEKIIEIIGRGHSTYDDELYYRRYGADGKEYELDAEDAQDLEDIIIKNGFNQRYQHRIIRTSEQLIILETDLWCYTIQVGRGESGNPHDVREEAFARRDVVLEDVIIDINYNYAYSPHPRLEVELVTNYKPFIFWVLLTSSPFGIVKKFRVGSNQLNTEFYI